MKAAPPGAEDYGRGIYLARVFSGAVLIHLVIGAFFTWANLTVYVTSYLRAHGSPGITYEETVWVLSIAGALLGVVAYFGGALHDVVGLRLSSLIGGVVLCVGVALSSLTVQSSFGAFFVSYTLLFGVGIGLCYSAPVKCAMIAMPDRRGTASGLVMCGMGLGSFVFTILQTWLVNPDNVRPDGVMPGTGDAFFTHAAILDRVPGMFLALALLYALLVALGVALMLEKNPAAEEAQAASAAEAAEEATAALVKPRDWTPEELLRNREFWLILGCYFLNMQAVMIFTGHMKVLGLGLLPGASDWQLTMVAGVSSWFNGLGRPGWGYLCDVTSFRHGMVALSAATALLTGTVCLCVYGGFLMYLVWMCLIFTCVGGICSIYAGATSAYFGDRHFGRNFGLMTAGGGSAWLTGAALLNLLRGRISDVGICIVTAMFSLGAVGCAAAVPDLATFKKTHHGLRLGAQRLSLR